MYFKLNASCFLVRGKKEGCIYDLSRNKIFKLNMQECDAIDLLDDGREIESVTALNIDILDKLVKEELGNFYSKPTFIDKIRFGLPNNLRNFKPTPVIIHNLYLQISDDCNMNCVYCRDDFHINRRTGCKKWTTNSGKIDFEIYKQFIDEAYKLNCKNVYIIGGEPFKQKDLLIKIIEYLK